MLFIYQTLCDAFKSVLYKCECRPPKFLTRAWQPLNGSTHFIVRIELLPKNEAFEPRVSRGKDEIMQPKIWRSQSWVGWPLWHMCFTDDIEYVPIVITTIPSSFPRMRPTEMDWAFGGIRVTHMLCFVYCCSPFFVEFRFCTLYCQSVFDLWVWMYFYSLFSSMIKTIYSAPVF